jgi:hypothetical protein
MREIYFYALLPYQPYICSRRMPDYSLSDNPAGRAIHFSIFAKAFRQYSNVENREEEKKNRNSPCFASMEFFPSLPWLYVFARYPKRQRLYALY